jgi:hypothetical protein
MPLLHRNEESKERSDICTELIGASVGMPIVKSKCRRITGAKITRSGGVSSCRNGTSCHPTVHSG